MTKSITNNIQEYKISKTTWNMKNTNKQTKQNIQ